MESRKFYVEDWRQYGRLTTQRDPLQIFFLFQLRGQPGAYPAEVEITGPGGEKQGGWATQVEFTAAGTAFLEVPCTLERPLPGRYGVNLLISGELVGSFPFQLPEP